METQPGQMNMEIDSSHSDESYEQCILNMQKKVRSKYQICINDVISKRTMEEADGVHGFYRNDFQKEIKRFTGLVYGNILGKLDRLFHRQPRLKKICLGRNYGLVSSCFTRIDLMTSDDDDDETLDDLKYIINFCGYNLTELNIRRYPHSEIMPLISDNCLSLKTLSIEFEVIREEDFKNAFSKMFHLEYLIIKWQCENATLPLTLVNSLGQVGGTLKKLYLQSKYDTLLPDLLASVFPELIALKELIVYHFRISESLIQSLDKLMNLTLLDLGYPSPNSHLVIDGQINMYPTLNFENLMMLSITAEYNVTDEFLINLCKNSKKLQHLSIIGTNITDDGMLALNNLSQLKKFDLGLKRFGVDTLETKNEFITDQSVTNLCNEKLCYLNISNCTKISNRSVIKLVENLANLRILFIENSMVNIGILNELSQLERHPIKLLVIWVSFKDSDGIFKSLSESHNVRLQSS